MSDEPLARAHAYVATEISRSDQKAAALVTALGIPLSVLVAVAPSQDLSVVPAALVGVSAAGFVTAMVTALLVIRPILGGADPPPGSYMRWARCTTQEEVLNDLAVDHRPARLMRRSQIALQKFRLLRLAVDITAGALIVLVIGLLAILFE
ncbi:Pycsar system effector family protein [Streptomyces cinnamoneus]|uniref:Pycsar system effector family protein n=1 Tax=Streptomyces cinnamoneus TaxID=53446 RepID=UPI0033E18F31